MPDHTDLLAAATGPVAATPPVTVSSPTAAPTAPAPDPAALRLSVDLAGGLGVKKGLLTVPVRGPDHTRLDRTHPDAGYRPEPTFRDSKPGRTFVEVRQLAFSNKDTRDEEDQHEWHDLHLLVR